MVRKLRQISRSLVSAEEHVGKHMEGVAGCLASAGSGGIAGGATCSDEFGNPLAQPPRLSASAASIGRSRLSLLFRFIRNFR